MKNNYINTLTFLILTLYTSISFSQEIQTFEINSSFEEEITGKNGTVIYFSQNCFNLKNHPKLTLKLKENLSIKENQLPFSIQFFYEGIEIGLKEGEKLDVFTPANNIKFQKHFILNSKNESGKIKWFKANHFYEQVYIELGGGISKTIYLHKDSINKKIKHKKKGFLTKLEYNQKYPLTKENDYINFLNKEFTHIYSDFFVRVKKKITFLVKHPKNHFFNYNFYILYKNHNAIIQSIKFHNEKLNFKNIPLFEQTYLVIISQKKGNNFYYDKIELNESLNNTELNLNLKKISKEKLKNLFKK